MTGPDTPTPPPGPGFTYPCPDEPPGPITPDRFDWFGTWHQPDPVDPPPPPPGPHVPSASELVGARC